MRHPFRHLRFTPGKRPGWRSARKWLWPMALALIILVGSAGFPLPAAQAANGNPAVIGPLPAGGVIRVYVQQNVADGPRVTVKDGAAVASHDGSGVINLLSVKTGDTIEIYVGNLGHGGQLDPGWEPPQGAWWCGHNGVGDGIKGFGGMEASAEAAGAPIVSRQCWEDWADGGYEDVTVIVTYDPATVDSTPPTTTASPAGTLGLNTGGHQWYVSPVQVSLSATDPDDAVSATYLDGAGYGGPKTYGAQGQDTFTYYSVDSHGNTEVAKSDAVWIDTVAPSASSSLAGTVGLAGWYVSAVQVSVAGSDPTSGINALELNGSAYSGPVTFSASGSTSYTYRAQDGAGNWSAAQNGSFKIDTDQPTASSSLAGTLGSGGWYVSPVQVTLTGADATSGLGALELNGAAYSGPATIGTQGTVNYTYRARDVAGNWSALANGSFKIDTVAPTVTPAFSGPAGSGGWYRGPVQVTLNSVDATSGMGALELNGAAYAPLTVSAEGATSFTYRGDDAAGNWSALQTGSLKIDSVAPSTAASLTGNLGAGGWYTTPVQVTLVATDTTSGVGSISLDGSSYAGPRTYSDGAHTITYFATDQAGNAETAKTLSFKVDTTAPAPSASLAGTAGSGGWYVSPVQISLSGSDAGSGLAGLELNGSPYASPVTVSMEGPTNFTYRAEDQAGNWSAQQSGSFKIDTVAPTTTASLDGTAGLAGWYKSPVMVTLVSADATSGVGTISLDGTPYAGPRTYMDGSHSLVYSAKDNAGNAETSQMVAFNVDTVPPAVSAQVTGSVGLAGWYVSPVTITLSGADATSGLGALELSGAAYSNPVVVSAQGVTNYTYRGQDQAGNWSAMQSGPFRVDTTAPATTATLSGTMGLHNIYVSPVQVSLPSVDTTSGVAQVILDGTPYTSPRVYTDGVHTLTYSAVDVAGNAEAPHTLTFTVDTQTPQTTVTVTGPKKDSGWYTGDVTVRFTTSPDAEVYVDGQLHTGPLIFTDNGRHTLHYHAVDRAGNTEADQTVSFGIDRDAPETSGSATVGPDGMIALDINLYDAVSGVRDGGIYVMSADWQVLKVFPFNGEHAHFDWDGRLDNGDPAPAGYFLLFYARDRAGNEVYHSLGAPTLVTPAATPVPSPTFVPTRQRTPTPRSSATPGRRATPGETAAPTDTSTPTFTPSPTIVLPTPPRATYAPLPTPTRLSSTGPTPPATGRHLNWLLVIGSLICFALLLFLALSIYRDPRPPVVRQMARLLRTSGSTATDDIAQRDNLLLSKKERTL